MPKNIESPVLSKSKEILKDLEGKGWITHWTRINIGLFYTQWGGMIKIGKKFEPDLWVFVSVNNLMWIMFFDTKKPKGGDRNQDIFFNKFNGVTNVVCAYITDAKQIKYLIQKVKGIPFNSSKYENNVKNSFESLPQEIN